MAFMFFPQCGEKVFAQDGSVLGVVNSSLESSAVLAPEKGEEILSSPAVLSAEGIVAWNIQPGVVNNTAVPVAGTWHRVPAGAVVFWSDLGRLDDDDPYPLTEYIVAVLPEGMQADLDAAPELFHFETVSNWAELADFLPRGTKILIVRLSRQWEDASVLRDIEGTNDLPGLHGEAPANQSFAQGWWGCCSVHGPEETYCPVCGTQSEQGSPVTWKAVRQATARSPR